MSQPDPAIDLSEYDAVLQGYAWAIYVLLYVAAADGAIRLSERKLIADFCMRRSNSSQLQAETMDALLKELGRPSKFDFHRFIRDRATSAEVMQDIFSTAKAIVASNSKPHTEQERALAYILKSWKQVLVR